MFFKKKLHPTSNHYNHFNDEEKLIILSLMSVAAQCDSQEINFDQKRLETEIKFLVSYVDIFNSSSKKAHKLLEKIGPRELFNRFMDMGVVKVNDALLLIYSILLCDGQMNEIEAAFFASMLEKLNITEDEFLEKLKKLEGLKQYFKL